MSAGQVRHRGNSTTTRFKLSVLISPQPIDDTAKTAMLVKVMFSRVPHKADTMRYAPAKQKFKGHSETATTSLSLSLCVFLCVCVCVGVLVYACVCDRVSVSVCVSE